MSTIKVTGAILLLLAAPAHAAPSLPVTTARTANDLQRAAWACEAGAPSLAAGGKATGRPRFFLSGADRSANLGGAPPMSLRGATLSGVGKLSDDRGWSNIRFTCALSPNLRQATSFRFETLSPIPQDKSPPRAGVDKAANAAKMSWYADGTTLVHGVRETDDQDFVASCVKGSGKLTIPLRNTVRWLKPAGYVTVGVTNGPGSGLYVGRGELDEELGVAVPILTVATTDPLLTWIGAGKSLLININGEFVYEVALNGAAPAARAFAAACR